MFGYCGLDVDLEPRARLGRHDLLGGPAQQRRRARRACRRRSRARSPGSSPAGAALDGEDVDEALAAGGRLRRELGRQRREHAPGEPRGVDELAGREARVHVDAVDRRGRPTAVNVSSVNSPPSEPSSVYAQTAPKRSMSKSVAPSPISSSGVKPTRIVARGSSGCAAR